MGVRGLGGSAGTGPAASNGESALATIDLAAVPDAEHFDQQIGTVESVDHAQVPDPESPKAAPLPAQSLAPIERPL